MLKKLTSVVVEFDYSEQNFPHDAHVSHDARGTSVILFYRLAHTYVGMAQFKTAAPINY